MTDEERREAELRADAILQWRDEPHFCMRKALIKAYGAACEAKKEYGTNLVTSLSKHNTKLTYELGEERVRSEKLIYAVKLACFNTNPVEQYHGIKDAVAEYEASYDQP